MGFDFSKYDSGSLGGPFITASEKVALASTGAPFHITRVSERASRFEHDTEYVLSCVIPEGVPGVDPGERTLTFPKGSNVGSRDALLAGMVDYFGGDDADDIPVVLTKAGKAYLIEAAR